METSQGGAMLGQASMPSQMHQMQQPGSVLNVGLNQHAHSENVFPEVGANNIIQAANNNPQYMDQ